MDKSGRGRLEAGGDEKLTPTLTIFTFASPLANEEAEDLPKSGIRSSGRGEERGIGERADNTRNGQ